MSVTRDGLAALVEEWRAILVPEWRVLLMAKPHPETDADDIHAESQSRDDYTEICIHFTDDCLEREREAVEVTVVHELLHALTRPWRAQIDSIASQIASPLYVALTNARSHEEEQLVDRLSRVLVEQRRAGATVGPGTRPGKDFA